jgi:hypothetical protein
MTLTRDFRETIRERAETDAAFRESLLREGARLVECGEVAVGAAILRNADAASSTSEK